MKDSEQKAAAKQKRYKQERQMMVKKIVQSDVCICPACKEPYDEDVSTVWVQCQACESWFYSRMYR